MFSPVIGAGAPVWRRKTNTQSFTLLEPTSEDGGYNAVLAHDINDRGFVAGTIETESGETRYPAVWGDPKGIVDMNTPVSGFGVSLNNHGVVTVQADVPLGALAWDTKRMTVSVLPSLGGFDRPFAYNINNRGQIVGMSNNPTGGNHAVMWEPVKRNGRR